MDLDSGKRFKPYLCRGRADRLWLRQFRDGKSRKSGTVSEDKLHTAQKLPLGSCHPLWWRNRDSCKSYQSVYLVAWRSAHITTGLPLSYPLKSLGSPPAQMCCANGTRTHSGSLSSCSREMVLNDPWGSPCQRLGSSQEALQVAERASRLRLKLAVPDTLCPCTSCFLPNPALTPLKAPSLSSHH